MEAKELRIGNWVKDKDGRQPIKIDLGDFCYIERQGVEDYEPISLTEEWLLKFGVNELLNQDVYRVNYTCYHKGTNCFNYCLGYYHDDQGYIDNIFKDIKHVHQLQNLYFALTGKELEIK